MRTRLPSGFGQRKRQKSNEFNEQNDNSAPCITLFCTFLCRPCTTRTRHEQILIWLENGNGKAINFTFYSYIYILYLQNPIMTSRKFSVWNRTRSPVFSSHRTSLLSSNWVTWYKGEKVVKDAKSIFQRRFHWRRLCRIVRSLMLGELRSAEWEVVGSNPARINNQGL